MRDRNLGQSLASLVVHPLIRRCLVAGSLAGALSGAPGAALADPQIDANYLGRSLEVWDNVDGHWKLKGDTACEQHLRELTLAHAPDSIMFELEHDTPELKAGKHPWAEGRGACAAIVAAYARFRKLEAFAGTLGPCKSEMKQAKGPTHEDFFDSCLLAYDQAIQAGIPPAEVVKDRDGDTATMQEMRDRWCVPGKAKLAAAEAERSAPFRKLLRNDKLRIALQDTDYIMLPGGAKVTPERLAATNVWFEDASPSKVCPNGAQVHVLHRYQFNAQQKLAKVTDHEYCGRPPAAAFR